MQRRTTLFIALFFSLWLLLAGASFAQSPDGSLQAQTTQNPSQAAISSPTNAQQTQGNINAQSGGEQNGPVDISQTQTPESQDSSQGTNLQSSAEQKSYSQARIVRLSYAEGDVRIDRGADQGFIKAFSNMPVVEGSRLKTGNDGRAEAEFEDASTIRLAPNSTLSFKRLGLGAKGERLSTVLLEQGEAYFEIKKRGGDEFALSLGVLSQQLVLKKQSHFRVVADSDGIKVADFKGGLELVKSDGKRVEIGKNESLSLTFKDPENYTVAHGISADLLDGWDRERDQQATLTATSRSLGYNSVYSSSMYSYGMQDLSQYGSYIFAPGFGYMWRPYYESVNWNPFQDGLWVFYPQYNNYMFVSAYPWGWQPYHYGSWVNVPGVGWCWNPRGNNNFVPVPIVAGAPVGFRPIRPPRPSPGASVIPIGSMALQNSAGIRGVSSPVIGSRIPGVNGVPQISARPIHAPSSMNAIRSERGSRIEGIRPMPAPVQAPRMQQPMSAPRMSAPHSMPAPTPSAGGRGPRDR